MFIHYLIGLIVGILAGYAITRVWVGFHMTWGYLAVDQNTKQVRLHLNPVDFENGKVKKVVFDVVYGARIPLPEDEDTRE